MKTCVVRPQAHLLQRAHTVYSDSRYARLADLSVSHLYNLRKRADYQAQRVSFVKTHPVCNPIGLRKAPTAAWINPPPSEIATPQTTTLPCAVNS